MITAAEKQAISEAVGMAIRAAKAELRAEFEKRIAELPKPEPPKPVDIEAVAERAAALIKPPKDGKDALPVDIDAIVLRAAELIPVPKDGAPGRDAEPVDTAAIVAEIVRNIPMPKDGKDGIDGKHGLDGKDGLHGKDAVVDFESIVRAVVPLIPAPQPGKDGRDGKDGEPGQSIVGPAGERGEPGESIHPDTVTLMVRDAVDSVVAKLPRPENGKPGEPGRDALQIEILPSILGGKTHPRGTYVRHRGGIVRSIRDTQNHPAESMTDWEVVVAGIPKIEVLQSDNLRSFTITVTNTDGEVASDTFSVPAMLYRDIFKDGEVYQRGDVVTYSGSAWHCQEDTRDRPGSKAWRLMVKEGRPAKEPKANEPPKDPGPIRLK